MVALLAKTVAETGWFDSPFERHFEGDYGRWLMDLLAFPAGTPAFLAPLAPEALPIAA